jgi:hypothetical protein
VFQIVVPVELPGPHDIDWSKEAMTMLMRTDPFGVLDRWTRQVFGQQGDGRPGVVPLDAYRRGDEFVAAQARPRRIEIQAGGAKQLAG